MSFYFLSIEKSTSLSMRQCFSQCFKTTTSTFLIELVNLQEKAMHPKPYTCENWSVCVCVVWLVGHGGCLNFDAVYVVSVLKLGKVST